MSQARIHKGDVGTTVIITVTDQDDAAVDITGATCKVRFRLPDRTFVEVAATVDDGPAGKMKYVNATTSIWTLAGVWRMQGYFEPAAGGEYSTEEHEFTVEDKLVA